MESLHIETSQCRPLPHQFRGNVNITCDKDSIILWNKYKLILYNRIDEIFYPTGSEPSILSPEVAIEKVLMYKNCILCLDCSGNININTKPDPEFNISKVNVTACEIMKSSYVICLEIKEHVTQLSIHKLNIMFVPKHVHSFSNPDDATWKTAPRAKNIITVQSLQLKELNKQIKLLFDVKGSFSDCFLVVICLDRINVYACIISEKQNTNLKIVKLYTSQSEIVGIHINTEKDISVLIGLSGGNIINVPLTKNEPKVVHLNTALYKFVVIKNTIIYTDGLTMWKIEDISNSDLKPEQFFVKNVRDFCVVRNTIICTTFSNLIYCFYMKDRGSYISLNNEGDKQLMTDSNLNKLMSVTQKNEELVEKINKEREYLLALSLSNRQSIMENLIQTTSIVFENYNDIERDIGDLTLTDCRNAYWDTQSYYFVIKITVTPIQHKLNKLLSGLLGDIKIHITLFADKVLKTTSIKINEQLKNKNFVIPLKRSEIANLQAMQVIVKIVTNIPGQMDEKQRQWTTLYSKSIELNAESLVRTTTHTNSTCLKEDDVPLETSICDIAKHLHGARYTFNLKN